MTPWKVANSWVVSRRGGSEQESCRSPTLKMREGTMKTSSTPHPVRTEFQDVMELSGGRIWMLCFEDPDCLQNIPRLFLEQYPNQDAFDDLQDDGRVWFKPEDMPRIIDMLASWLDAYRAS